MPLSRDATEQAYLKHRAVHEAGRWPDLANLFAPDARYHDPFFGEMVGREAIRAFLVKSMTGLEDWSFPISWVNIDAGRVVSRWHNRLPGRRRDGGYFEFAGMSAISYDDSGQIIEQIDLYDRAETLQIIAEARSRLVERGMTGVRTLGGPLLDGLHRLVSR